MAPKSSELENVAGPAATSAAAPIENRDELASKLIENFALWAGAAGIIPIPLLDLAAIGGLQLQMVRRLSEIYEIPFSENRGKAVLASLAGSMIPATSGIGAASFLKVIPIVGTIASALALPALAGGATYAIGKAFMQHFASGGTFLDFNPPDYREFIKVQKKMWSSQTRPANKGDDETSAHPAGAQESR